MKNEPRLPIVNISLRLLTIQTDEIADAQKIAHLPRLTSGPMMTSSRRAHER